MIFRFRHIDFWFPQVTYGGDYGGPQCLQSGFQSFTETNTGAQCLRNGSQAPQPSVPELATRGDPAGPGRRAGARGVGVAQLIGQVRSR